MRRIGTATYGFFAYACFFITFLYLIGFVGNFIVPKSMNGGEQISPVLAILINSLLLSLFGLQHSIMARPFFKRWWTRYVPKQAERSTYVLLASAMLALAMAAWQPLPHVLWNFEGTALGYGFLALMALGWALVLTSTFTIDHFQLFGLKQVIFYFMKRDMPAPAFVVRGLYHLVRHPLMLGFLIAFWATPHMTVGHLQFALIMTGYIMIALRYEERDLLEELGAEYAAYQARTPLLNPLNSPALRGERTEDESCDAVPLFVQPQTSTSGGYRLP